ncbi:matrixin family metalloprotease [Kineococcus glutinatus]|uniref:Peptidase metallopeptidase domain-containing protein n=1 Tax=Kineococcus glutinatus TaxID=1070872 RepID=A0ABP9HHD7_9ACTN
MSSGTEPRSRVGDIPRSPTGRVPQWVMDEATGRASTPPPWRGPTGPAPARRGSRWRGAGLAAAVVAVLGVSAWAQFSGALQGTSLVYAGRSADVPTPGQESEDAPLGQPAPLVQHSDAWRPMRTQADGTTPVRWDPCRPIHYVTRTAGAPAGGQELLQEALQRVSEATGLRFVDDGSTDEGPSPQRASFQPDRYGDRWAPVLITWVSADEVPDIAASVVGQAGPAGVTTPEGEDVYVSGTVELDAGEVTQALAHPGGDAFVRLVLEHELAHLVGLAHVNDPTELMYPVAGAQGGFGPGDLTGLAALGTGGCIPEV